jgi:hypothetical protein
MLTKLLIGWVALSVPVGVLVGRVLRLGHHPLGNRRAQPVESVNVPPIRRSARSA